MTLSPQEESNLRQVYEAYWANYLKGDSNAMAPLLDEAYTQVGSAESEVFFTKHEAVQFLHDTINQVAGQLEMRNRVTKIEPHETFVLVHELADVYVLIEGEWNFYAKFRASSMLHLKNSQWKIFHQHSSFADSRTEQGENIAIEKIALENLQLREAVKRRTTELEHKNWELEIEAALEKVRAVAMSMRAADDLLNVCEVLYQQLQSLGFGELRNTMINIHSDDQGTFVNYDYSDEIGKSITPLYNSIHPVIEKQIKQIRSSNDAFSETIFAGKELEDWKAFRRKSGEREDSRINSTASLHYYLYSIGTGSIGISTFSAISIERLDLLKRFRNVFNLSYQRYMDITLAEAQAREARIELALERVRARTMAMQRSEEMVEASHVLFNELHALGIETIRTGIGTFDEEKETVTVWSSQYVNQNDAKILGIVPKMAHPFFEGYYNAWKKKEPYFTFSMSGNEVKSYYTTMASILSYPLQSEFNSKETFQTFFFPEGSLNVITHEPLSEESCQLLIRFARVFGLIYRRFLDLKQAEAQTHEARIEAALEKVRAVAMSMHTSEDLLNVCEVLFHELGHLGFTNIRNAIIDIYDDEKKWKLNYDYSDVMGKTKAHVPYDIHPFIEKQIREIRSGEDAFSETVFTGQELEGWKEFRRKSGQPDDPRVTGSSTLHYYFFSISKGSIGISTFGNIDVKELELLKRFRNVFSLSYQRYIDIAQAEAQAREAKIEAALERVRSRSLAMHQSSEMEQVIMVICEQLKQLEFRFHNTSFVRYNDQRGLQFWLAVPGLPHPFNIKVPYLDHPIFNRPLEKQKQGFDFHSDVLTAEENRLWLNHLYTHSELRNLPEEDKQQLLGGKGYARSLVMMKHIMLVMGNYAGIPYTEEQNAILKRFGKVFDQSYTRFLDLQKAEAQTREAQVEASLERVRSKAMAMHTSDDLSETVKVYFQELKSLGMILLRCGVIEYGDEPYLANLTVTSATTLGDSFQVLGSVKQIGHPVLEGIYEHWVRQEEFYPVLKGKDLHSYNQVISSKINLPDLPEDTTEYGYYFYFKEGSFFVWAQEKLSDDAVKLFRRFTSVLSLTYRRYLDLLDAEKQAKEAKIEAGLERVRSRTMAMHSSDELAETAAVVFRQLIGLGIAPTRLYIGIIQDDSSEIEMWATDEDGSKVNMQFAGNINRSPVIHQMYDGWKVKLKSLAIDLKGKELQDYFQYLSEELHVPFRLGLEQKRRVQNVAYFSKGFIGIASPEPQPEETTTLLERFAGVFNLTFTRFNDLKLAEQHAEQAREDLIKLQIEKKRAEEALTELRATQAQLIQSEKMASLGELTAGIAHEIQNPLNFVNNFSEVNTELIDELNEELATGNLQSAKEIADNIKENEQKIVHHGKRADAIVKGMLQHSRSSTGAKEPTDINALADEYLRLAYHGLRAKDKSFNATMKTDFDPNIGLVNVIPQDIGRVILNLITNAFYAVSAPNPSSPLPPVGSKKYEPTVTVTTKRYLPPTGGKGGEEDRVEIHVRDNGPGIPQHILDKIFQPFFTTKPTGQGTGLGLSLSYDIIKAHGGELKVETKEGEGAEFIIELPAT